MAASRRAVALLACVGLLMASVLLLVEARPGDGSDPVDGLGGPPAVAQVLGPRGPSRPGLPAEGAPARRAASSRAAVPEPRDQRRDEDEPGLSVAGLVTDDLGRAVDDFVLRVRPAQSDDHRLAFERSVQSVEGRYELRGLGTGAWRIGAYARDHLDSEVRVVEVPFEGELPLVLERAPLVSGRVTAPDGAPPWRHARVTIETLVATGVGLEPAAPRTAGEQTERDGSFRMEGVVGAVRVFADCEGFAASEPFEVELEPGASLEGLELRLRAGGRIEVQVAADTSRALDDLRVALVGPGRPAEPLAGGRTAPVDATGAFVFETLTPGAYRVSTLPPGGEDELAWRLAAREGVEVEVQDGRTTRVLLGGPVEFLLRGRVVRDGEPVAGAGVQARAAGLPVLPNARTDEQGDFRLDLPRGGTWVASVYRPGWGSGSNHDFEVPGPGEHELLIELAGAAVSGRVTAGGLPVEGCTLGLEDGSGRQLGLWSTTDAEGRFELSPVDDGEHTLTLARPGWGTEERSVSVAGGRSPAELAIELEPGGVLHGVVRGEAGDVVPNAAVFLRLEGAEVAQAWSPVTTDPAGRFRLEGVGPGRAVVVARCPRGFGLSRAVTVAAGEETEVEVRLAPATLVGLVVRDGDTELRDARVAVLDDSGLDHAALHSPAEWDRRIAGRTHVVGPLPPGRYRAAVGFADGGTVEQELAVDGEPLRLLELARP